MNIVYVIEDYSENGGVERIVSMKANILASTCQHHVTVISVYLDHRPQKYQLDQTVSLQLLNVPFAQKSKCPIRKLYSRTKTLITAAHRLNKALKSINPDVVFFTTTLGALLLPLCHTQAKKIYESHCSRSFNPYHQLFRWMEKKADAIVCLTKNDANEYVHARKVYVIPNFINQPTCLVKDYSCKKAIAVGRLEYQKGFDRLISCWKEATLKYPDWKLDIYGEGSLHDALQAQITALHLEQQITLCGRKENMMEQYPNYSLHLMSSHYEGLPIVLIEAQACGLPSVTFNYQYGAKDIVTNGVNGILVEQDNETAFITAMQKMMENSETRLKMGKNALLIGKLYSREHIFQKWQELLLTILS